MTFATWWRPLAPPAIAENATASYKALETRGRGMWATYRAGFALAAAALLTGCATAPDNRVDVVLSTVQHAQENLNACIIDTYNDPQFEPLSTHMPMNMRGVSMDQLRDDHFATDNEITMLTLYEESAQACRKSYLAELRPIVPTVAALTAAAYSRNEEHLADLMQKKLSWGGYISGVVASYRTLTPKVAAELKRITVSLNGDRMR
jgi:hypothetical protein